MGNASDVEIMKGHKMQAEAAAQTPAYSLKKYLLMAPARTATTMRGQQKMERAASNLVAIQMKSF